MRARVGIRAFLWAMLVGTSAVAQTRASVPAVAGGPASSPAVVGTSPSVAQSGTAGVAGAPPISASPSAPLVPATPPAATSPAKPSVTHGEVLRAYHEALGRRRLGSQEQLTGDELRERLAEVEDLTRAGRTDEAIARMAELVEHPKFDGYADSDDGHAAIWLLGDALATAGAYEPARAYLRRLIAEPAAWQGTATLARRAVRRLVEIGLEADAARDAVLDLAAVPATAPEETRGDVAYINGRAHEAAGDPDGAVAAYDAVGRSSRFWAQATYLHGLILVEKRRFKESEALFCKVADPTRRDHTSATFGDEHYFAIRDLARLALGRIAHEQYRFDDARYYYYLVPRDSDRLAEALYEAATSRYEKKDYVGARELLDELDALANAAGHHRYEDEAWILGAYVDLAQCKFEDADKKLVAFLARYEPVRNGARRVAQDQAAMRSVLVAARTGSDAGGAEVVGAVVSADVMRAIAALVRLDPAYAAVVRRRAVLERESSGLRAAVGEINDIQQGLATNGGVRPAVELAEDHAAVTEAARRAVDGVRHALDELEASHAPAARTAPLREQLLALDARLTQAKQVATASLHASEQTGVDLPDLLRADSAHASELAGRVESIRAALVTEETRLAKDALHRLDLRLSRLLRRARLGRVESVLGRKRTLEVEIEAINDGVIPKSAVDSLDAARYLRDNEEYWPFEGDDWPDEFVGSEVPK
jgi:tetratricopeptide (TPR) repeat protein